MTIAWQKTNAFTLESVPRRYIIEAKRDSRFKDYEAYDTIADGYVGARRGLYLKDTDGQLEAIQQLKKEVEEYDARFG